MAQPLRRVSIQKLDDVELIIQPTIVRASTRFKITDLDAIYKDPKNKTETNLLLKVHQWRSEMYSKYMKPFSYVIRASQGGGSARPLMRTVVNGETKYLAVKSEKPNHFMRIVDCVVVKNGDSGLRLELVVATPDEITSKSQVVNPLQTRRIEYDDDLELVQIDAKIPLISPINTDGNITDYTNTWLPDKTDLLAVQTSREQHLQERTVFRKLYGKRVVSAFDATPSAKLTTFPMPIFNNEKMQTLRIGHSQYHLFLYFLVETEIKKVDVANPTLGFSKKFETLHNEATEMAINPALIALSYVTILLLPLWATPDEDKEEYINSILPKLSLLSTKIKFNPYVEELFFDNNGNLVAEHLFGKDGSIKIGTFLKDNSIAIELKSSLIMLLIIFIISEQMVSPNVAVKLLPTPEKKAAFQKKLSALFIEEADILTVMKNIMAQLPDDDLTKGMDKQLKALIYDTLIDVYDADSDEEEDYAFEGSEEEDDDEEIDSSEVSSEDSSEEGSREEEEDGKESGNESDRSSEAEAMLKVDDDDDDDDGDEEADGSNDKPNTPLQKAQQADQSADEKMSIISESTIDIKTFDPQILARYRESSKRKFIIRNREQHVHFNILLQFLQGSRLTIRDYDVVKKHARYVRASLFDALSETAKGLGIADSQEIKDLLKQTDLVERYVTALVAAKYFEKEEVASLAALLDIPSFESGEEVDEEEISLKSSEEDDSYDDERSDSDDPFSPLQPDSELHAMFAQLEVVNKRPGGVIGMEERNKMLKIETALRYRFFRYFDESMQHLYNNKESPLRTLLRSDVRKLLDDEVASKLRNTWMDTFRDRLAINIKDEYYWVIDLFFSLNATTSSYVIKAVFANIPLAPGPSNIPKILGSQHPQPIGEFNVITFGLGRDSNEIAAFSLINSKKLSQFVDVGNGYNTWVAPSAFISLEPSKADAEPTESNAQIITMLFYNDNQLARFVDKKTQSIILQPIAQKQLRGTLKKIVISTPDDDVTHLILDSMLLEPIPIPHEIALTTIRRRDVDPLFRENFGMTENPTAPPPPAINTLLSQLKYDKETKDSMLMAEVHERMVADVYENYFTGNMEAGFFIPMTISLLAALRIINGGRVTLAQFEALQDDPDLFSMVQKLIKKSFDRIDEGTVLSEEQRVEQIKDVFLFNKKIPNDWKVIKPTAADAEGSSKNKRYNFVVNQKNLIFNSKAVAPAGLEQFRKQRAFDYHLDTTMVKRDTLKFAMDVNEMRDTDRHMKCFALAAAMDASYNAHYIKHGGHYIIYMGDPQSDNLRELFAKVATNMQSDSGRFPVVTVVSNRSDNERFILSIIGNRPILYGIEGPYYYLTRVNGELPVTKVNEVLKQFHTLGQRFTWTEMIGPELKNFDTLFGSINNRAAWVNADHAILAHALMIGHAFSLSAERINIMARGKNEVNLNDGIVIDKFLAAFYYPSIALHWDLNYTFGSFLTPSESAAQSMARPGDLKRRRNRRDDASGLIQNIYARESHTFQLAKLYAHNQVIIDDKYEHKKTANPGNLLADVHNIGSFASLSKRNVMSQQHVALESSFNEFRSRAITNVDPYLSRLRSDAHEELIRSEAVTSKKKKTAKPRKKVSRSKSRTSKKGKSKSRSPSPSHAAKSKKGKSKSRSPSPSHAAKTKTPSKKGASRSPSPSHAAKAKTSSKKGTSRSPSPSPATKKASTKKKTTSSRSPSPSVDKKQKKTSDRASRSPSPSKKDRTIGSKPSPSSVKTSDKKETKVQDSKVKTAKADGGRSSRSPSPDRRGRRSSRSPSPSTKKAAPEAQKSKPVTPKPVVASPKQEKRSSKSPVSKKTKSDRASRSPSRASEKKDDRRDVTPQRRRDSSRSPQRTVPVPSVTTVVVRTPSLVAPAASSPSVVGAVSDLIAQQQANRQMNLESRRDEQTMANDQRTANLEAQRQQQELRRQDLDLQEREATLRNRLATTTPNPSTANTQVTTPDRVTSPSAPPTTTVTPISPKPQNDAVVASQRQGWFDMNGLLGEINRFKW